MANKRDTSQQKRAKQNRAQRAALQARTEGGPPKRPSRVAPVTAEKLATKKEAADPGSTSAKAAAPTTRSGKPRRERPPKPGDKPVDIATLEGGWYSKVQQVPGGSQVVMAALMTVVVTIMSLFLPLFVSKEDQAKVDFAKAHHLKKVTAKATQTILESQGTARGLMLLAIPVVAVLISLAFALHPQRRRVWLAGAIVVAITVATQVPFYIVVAGFLGFAVYKAYKVEGPNTPLWRRRSQVSDPVLDVTGSEEDGDPA